MVLCAALATPGTTDAAEAMVDQQLADACADLDAWLGGGDNGDQWRDFLRWDKLQAIVASAEEGEAAQVAEVLRRFESDAPGLEKRRFRRVRELLQRRLSRLKTERSEDLPALARASRKDYRPVTQQRLEDLQRRLRESAADLMRTLGEGSSLAAGWRSYLKWQSLEPHLSLDADPTSASLVELDEVIRQFRTNAPGLEHPAFQQTVDALVAYRETTPWALAQRIRDPGPSYERNLETLAVQLERHRENPTSETAWKVGRVVGLVQLLGDSP
ncbi:MAG: hypothetical protein KDA61_06400, partial [Planctomycetales bacterium]|nr:hypothetical protein [Planctomycetales bacterium]